MFSKAKNASFHRIGQLAKKLTEKEYRDAYVSSHLRTFLAGQIKALRGNLSQAEFGEVIEKPQSVVSRLENPNYGQVTMQTLLEIAAKLDVALVVRFVSYPTFLRITSDFSDEALKPKKYDSNDIEAMVTHKPVQVRNGFMLDLGEQLRSPTYRLIPIEQNNGPAQQALH